MIDLTEEKKSLGVISVTRVTETSRRRVKFHAMARAFSQFSVEMLGRGQRPAARTSVTRW
jgi:hypothetical protein